jgi:hypothetical protein
MAENTGDTGFDMDAAVSEIASGLNLGDGVDQEEEITEEEPEADAPVIEEPAPAGITEPPKETQPQLRAVPKSWPKEMHEHWPKVDPKVQEYWENREKQMLDGLDQYKGDAGYGKQIRDITTPYKALLNSQGVDEVKAVQYFMNAHYKLSTLPPAEKAAYFANLGKAFGVDLGAINTEQSQVDPQVKALQDQVHEIRTSLTAREQAATNEARTRVDTEVEAFAKANPYFDEVADDIVAMIRAGYELKDAYEKAVWANPVTRAKEMARVQTENEKQLREKSEQEAKAARKAASPNVRGRDTNKAPTEPLGKMEDTMRETLKAIRSRSH